MKPKRFFFRNTALFGTTLRCGAPVFVGFTVLVLGLDSAHAAIYGGRANGNGSTAPQPGAPVGGAATPATNNAVRANAQDALARTNQAVGAAKALQDAARAAAAAGANNAGQNPNNLGQTLPNVPNGLGAGGLQIAPGAVVGSGLWTGANLPGQTTSADGKVKVTVQQTSQQALLTWESFNVGKNTTLTFDQSAAGGNAAQWIAFNKVNDPSGNPTQILGQIKAEGQVYIINRNGIIFGGSSQVNVRGLTVSSLPLNMNLVERGLLNNPDAQFLFSGLSMPAGTNGTPAFTPEAPPVLTGKYGDVIVQEGAQLTSPTNAAKTGGRITLVGANVTNDGTISTPDGQTILASGLQVGFKAHDTKDASLRGLDVYVGSVGTYAGTTTNNGVIESPRGSITIAGKNVNQTGVLDSTTSVSLNGRIDIQAQYNAVGFPDDIDSKFLFQDTGTIDLGAGSVIRILPELESTETTVGTALAFRSQINMTGRAIRFGEGSILLAPNAQVGINAGIYNYIAGTAATSTFVQAGGQVYFEEDALIDVAGLRDVLVPVSQNIIEVQLRGAELANSPLQRFGILRNATVYVDIRDAGIYQGDGWTGTALADISGFANLIQKPVAQYMVAGGEVTISAGNSVVMQAGSTIDVSGGSIRYQEGSVKTTNLISNGRLVDIRDARPDETYDGIYDGTAEITNSKWGSTETYTNSLAPSATRFEAASIEGAAGGSINITAPSMALDGGFRGETVQGDRQRSSPAPASSLKLRFVTRDLSMAGFPIHAPTAPDIIFKNGDGGQAAAAAFALDANGNPPSLSAERLETVFLSPDLLAESGFGSLTIENNGGNIVIPEEVTLQGPDKAAITLVASNITVDGTMAAAGGSFTFKTFGLTLHEITQITLNDFADPFLPGAGRGLFTLGENAVISTAGRVVDDSAGSGSAGSVPLTLDGGSVNIEGYSANLAGNGLIDVSGGAALSARGAITYGKGGNLSVAAGREINFSASLGGELTLGATFKGLSGTKGGSLSLTGPAFQIGGTSTNPGVTLIQPEFFSEGGFSSISLGGIGLATATPGEYTPGVLIAPGTAINPVVRSWFGTDSANGAFQLESVLREEGVRNPVNLSFNSLGASYKNQLLVVGNTVMGEGASITTDAKGSVSLSGETVTILGSISAAGGSITVKGAGRFPVGQVSEQDTLALATTHLGSTAFLSAAGKTVLVENSFGLRQGEVLAGGTVSIQGNIVAERGAVIDVSGTSGVLDLPPRQPSGTNGPRTEAVTVNSNGGTISLAGSAMLFTDATLIGKAGGSSANGGTLNISSGRFNGTGVTYTDADANLVVTQDGIALPNGTAPVGVGIQVLDADGNTRPQIGNFAVSSYASGGFDSLALNGNVRFEGDVSIHAPGSLRVASGGDESGVIYANGKVELTAGYVALGRLFEAPSQTIPGTPYKQRQVGSPSISDFLFLPTHGEGELVVKADLIDIGTLSLQGIGAAGFWAESGDIRGNGVLRIAGDLAFKAGQIYPTTQGDFSIFAYDYSQGGVAQEGSVTITGGSSRALPLSAGGTLSIYASTISQGGTLRAPIGTINLGWDGTGTAPVDYLAGSPTAANPFTRPVTSQLTLESGSTTSVSAIDPITGKGVRIPYGISLDGKSWIDPAGNDITLSGAPAKAINLSAGTVATEEGSTLDIRGGGDLYAYRWISGNGGTSDVLASTTSFAILPGYQFDYAPYAPFNTDTSVASLDGQPGYTASSLRPGDTITLDGSSGLPAGTYTLLPARYALLKGAFLVTPQSGTPVASVSRPDGSSIVSGYLSNDLDPARSGVTLAGRFEIASTTVVRQRSEYQDLLANTVLRDAAIAKDFAVPRLPMDSGYLSFSASAGMSLGGQVSSLAANKGRGSVIDINSPVDILINETGTGGATGTLVLSASLLNSFGAESLLIGGLRSFGTEGATVTANTGSITLDNAGSPLTGTDIILVAKEELTLAEGASITGTGGDEDLDTIIIGSTTVSGSGDGTLVRVSGNDTASVVRRGVSDSTVPTLAIGANARLSGGSITLDSTSATFLDSSVGLEAKSLSLSSGQISIQLDSPGILNPTTGLVLSGEALDSLQASAERLALRSYSTFDVYGTGQVGSRNFQQLSLQARAIRGFNLAGGTATFSAENLLLENASHPTALALPVTPLDGRLVFDAKEITLGANPLLVGNVANVSLVADSRLVVSGAGSFRTSGNLNLVTPLVTASPAADHAISAGGNLSLSRTAGNLPAGATGGLGAKLTLEGRGVEVNSDILLPSGTITLTATAGDVLVGNTASAKLSAAGTTKTFVDAIRYTSGGVVNLNSTGGSVRVGEEALITVAAPAGGGDAGQLNVKAADGSFVLEGEIDGFSKGSARKGGFSLDAGSIAGGSLAPIDAALNEGNFTESREYRIRTGNVLIDGKVEDETSANARDYSVSADSGSITVTGDIDASGKTGGTIHLQSTASIVLADGSLLTVAGDKFSSAGKGGAITLEAGSQKDGVVDSAAVLDIRSGSTLDLSVAEHIAGDAVTPGTSAFNGRFTGKLHLRAPRNAANNDLQIGAVDGTITGASSILVEGYKIYDLTGSGTITTAVQSSIKADGTAFLGTVATPSANYDAIVNRLLANNDDLEPVLVLAPGAEIINRTGDLTLGSLTSTATADWNLETFRFGEKSAPGVLTLRAAGDLVFYNALSDGFAEGAKTSTSLWLAPLMTQSGLLPINTQSWSYRLTSGADFSGADFRDVNELDELAGDKGSLLVGKNYGNAASYGSGDNFLTSTAIANRYQVIRTGSGDITVNSGRNAYLLNQFASIYTAGTQVAAATSLFSPGDFVVPVLQNTSGPQPDPVKLGAAQQVYPVQYSMAGGDVTISAGADIARMTRTVQTGNGGILIADSSRQLPNNWLYRRGYVDPLTGEFGIGGVSTGNGSITDLSASTTWWVDFSNFFEGVATLGGGDVTLSAANNISNVDAAAPTNARMSRGAPDPAKLVELGGGDLTITAGSNIDGGVYYVERGQGALKAGGSITTNSTRSPSRGIVASLTNPARLDSSTWLATTLFLGKGGFDIEAAGDLLLGAVANPFLLPQGNGNKFWYKTYFNTYSPDSYVNATSLGGTVTHRTKSWGGGEQDPSLLSWLRTQQHLTTSTTANAQPWLRLSETTIDAFATLVGIMAPTLRSTSFSGDINIAGDLILAPSPRGQLELLSAGSISGLQPVGLQTSNNVRRWITSTVNLSDADPSSIPGITTPYAYQQVVGNAASALRVTGTGAGSGFLNFINAKFAETGSLNGVLQAEQTRHTSGLLHKDDEDPVRLYALGGDLDAIRLFTPKAGRVVAGNDITDVAFYFQNLAASDTSFVSAGRDIILYNANSASRQAAGSALELVSVPGNLPLAGDIQISGPGYLQVLAGRDLDLGLGPNNEDGTGVGITSTGNSRNPYLSFEGADILLGAGIGPAASLADSHLKMAAFIEDFVLTPEGDEYLEKIAPGLDFEEQSPEEQARIAMEIFYLILRDTGRDFNDPDSPDYRAYTKGFAAIESLFGEGPWDGEIRTQSRDVRTRNGGDISIFAPGGGLTLANTAPNDTGADSGVTVAPGIVTEGGGKISIFTDQSVNIGIGRIFTLRGGNISIWSSKGDIAAGSSSRTVSSAPPTRVLIDPQSAAVETDLGGLATGGGIGVLASVEGVEPGDIDLIAPAGRIDAGDAGIRVSGNINLAAVTVVNAANISAGGSSSGAPAAAAAPSVGTTTSAAAAAAATGNAALPGENKPAEQAAAEELPSLISVEVIGYGGGGALEEDDKEEEERLRKAAEDAESNEAQ